MARINVGISPTNLTDQHLIAESVEITMITGALRKDGYKIKGEVPKTFCLGTGHINFFKNKLLYLKKRLDLVNEEIANRGMKSGTHINLDEFPAQLRNDWKPAFKDSIIVRLRIQERINQPLKAKEGFHKYNRVSINKNEYLSNLLHSKVNEI